MKPLDRSSLRGTWATLLLPIEADDSIDFARLALQVEYLVANGLGGLYAHGSAGEFWSLSEDEFDRINLLLAERCERAGVPFQIGACHLHPRAALERVRRAAALRPGAIQVALPDWVVVNNDEAIAFLQRVAEAAALIGLVVYNPRHAKRQFAPEDFAALASAVPAIIGIKVSREEPAWYAEMQRIAPRLAVFAPGPCYASAAIKWGARGSYSLITALHPHYARRWEELIASDPPRALVIEQKLKAFLKNELAPVRARFGLAGSSTDKFLATAAGWTDVGPRMRWPYRGVPEAVVAEFRPLVRQLIRDTIPESEPNS